MLLRNQSLKILDCTASSGSITRLWKSVKYTDIFDIDNLKPDVKHILLIFKRAFWNHKSLWNHEFQNINFTSISDSITYDWKNHDFTTHLVSGYKSKIATEITGFIKHISQHKLNIFQNYQLKYTSKNDNFINIFVSAEKVPRSWNYITKKLKYTLKTESITYDWKLA